ncbi:MULTISPECIES: DUF5681 domain-containing protein [unclassified Polynucleobacter]|uniref:DUF5681 domain-containing protein n=1 Tax=unclassified Polynucleobacter TaxID=2640945 RepID=UPI0008ABEA7C|nr:MULTISPECIES: DUF5681 domain-containing protein [unclassified Polynucleobacter]OHC09967.1 MAG: hypothetical protein A2X74_09325 [Polynucleobacter sp. GWA2_45_21]HBK43057.1 hypothetical protein [Polynucleobacter sp.]
MTNENKDYLVGFKKPPTSGKFKKGRSGNPKGRPKGSKNFRTYLNIELKESINITENGEHKRVPKSQAAAKKYANMAVMGDPKMIPILLKLDDIAESQNAQVTEAAPPSYKDKLVMSSIVERMQQMQMQEPAQVAAPPLIVDDNPSIAPSDAIDPNPQDTLPKE